MERALQALLRSPQNNLRIFKEGSLVYEEGLADEAALERLLADWFSSEDPLKAFLGLVRHALLRAFDADRDLPAVTTYELADGLGLPSRLDPKLVQRVGTLLAGVQVISEDKGCSITPGKHGDVSEESHPFLIFFLS
jgi:hypothetical protein